jgi:hypothetical protein
MAVVAAVAATVVTAPFATCFGRVVQTEEQGGESEGKLAGHVNVIRKNTVGM